jgi:alpha-glucosidase
VWDETLAPIGEIGKYAVLARRSGRDWYVAAIGDSNEETMHLPLKFLKAGVTYATTLYYYCVINGDCRRTGIARVGEAVSGQG